MESISKNELKEIGERIKSLRLAMKEKTSQTKLAQILGYSDNDSVKSIVCDWEKGHKLPPLEKIIKMSEIFNVSTDYILCKTDYKHIGNEEFSELTKLSDKSIELLRKTKETGDNRYTFMLDMLLSDEKTFNSLMDNLIELTYPSTFVIPLNNIPQSLLNENKDVMLLSPEYLKTLNSQSPDAVYHRIRQLLEEFSKKNKDKKIICPNEYHPI